MAQNAPSGASEVHFEAVRGPAQFKLRAFEAMLRCRQFKPGPRVVWSQHWQILCSSTPLQGRM
eukprot:14503913-Alexandrium_andersonii.AAC.1